MAYRFLLRNATNTRDTFFLVPRFRMRLVIVVVVSPGPPIIIKVSAVDQGDMPITKEHIIALPMTPTPEFWNAKRSVIPINLIDTHIARGFPINPLAVPVEAAQHPRIGNGKHFTGNLHA